MKRNLLTKMLLLATGLLVGASATWAQITETYDFTSMSDVIFVQSSISYTNADKKTVCLPANADMLRERFAFDDPHNTWNSAWQIRSKSGGLTCLNKTGYVSIVDLNVGDKVTFTIDTNYNPNLTFKSGNAKAGESAVTAGTTQVENNVEYTITEAGTLDLYWGNSSSAYADISKVVIVTASPTITRPSISTAAKLENTEITITPGVIRGNGTGTVVTKYAYSSIAADKESGTEYTDVLTTTEANGTVYAYSYIDATDGMVSEVVSKEFETVTYVKTKVIDFTTLGHAGLTSGSAWSTDVTGSGSRTSQPTWVIAGTAFIPELSFGSNMHIVSNYNYIGVRNSNASSITIDDLTTSQIAKLVAQPANTANDVLQYGTDGTKMTVPGYRIASKLEYYSPASTTVTLNVGEAGLATYMGSYTINLEGNADIAAYKATVSGATVTLTKVNVVPAGEAVLLRSLKGGSAETTVSVAAYSAWAAADNAFVGAYKEKTVNQIDGDYTNFVLSKEGDVVGFFKAKTEEDGGTSVGAGKAYLPVLTSGLSADARVMLVFGDETTGIDEIQTVKTTSDTKFYNLNGQQVIQPAKGLYIINGKKVIIK